MEQSPDSWRGRRPDLRLADRPPGRAAAFFDLDRTMLPGSSLFPLLRELQARGCLGWRDVAHLGAAHVRFRSFGEGGEGSLQRVREASLRAIRGLPREWVLDVAGGVVRRSLLPRLYPQAVFLVHAHRWAGHDAFIVTSSPQDYASLLADVLGMDGALGTAAEIRAGCYTGRLEGPVNRGERKAERIRTLATGRGVELATSFAYSDGYSDLPMLELVGHPVAVNADRRLREVARSRRWRIMDFGRAGPSVDRVRVHAELVAGLA